MYKTFCTHARAQSQKYRSIMMAGKAGIIIGLTRSGRIDDRVDSRVDNRFKYRGTVDRCRYECMRGRTPRDGDRKKKKKKKELTETLRVVKPNAIIFVSRYCTAPDPFCFSLCFSLAAVSRYCDRKRSLNAVFTGIVATITSRDRAKHWHGENSNVLKKKKRERVKGRWKKNLGEFFFTANENATGNRSNCSFSPPSSRRE